MISTLEMNDVEGKATRLERCLAEEIESVKDSYGEEGPPNELIEPLLLAAAMSQEIRKLVGVYGTLAEAAKTQPRE